MTLTLPRLPTDTRGDWPCCPWCLSLDMADAKVTLGALCDAFTDDCISRPWRGDCGQPDPRALVVECPNCARPSMVALRNAEVRLLAVRTKTDVELLGGVWGRPL